ncbi:hypothetical protein TNCV_1286791 [Trichonephila clavipes]|nr:hypothetical protein TNCV_1286791 [Trichonephila clavipes]
MVDERKMKKNLIVKKTARLLIISRRRRTEGRRCLPKRSKVNCAPDFRRGLRKTKVALIGRGIPPPLSTVERVDSGNALFFFSHEGSTLRYTDRQTDNWNWDKRVNGRCSSSDSN